jgi:hypothetical protein
LPFADEAAELGKINRSAGGEVIVLPYGIILLGGRVHIKKLCCQ